VSDVSLTTIMLFHFEAAMQMMDEILTHELVNPDELYEILEYREKDSESIQEERLWKMLQSFLIRANRLPADVIPFSPDLRGPDARKE
tara:strand:- start:78 stop:341 length:264 start_codon:yes stop_codon:yes gene_type:complete